MAASTISTVFFDLGDTLGTPVLSPPPAHLVGFEVFAFTTTILKELQANSLRLGVISNTGDDAGPVVDGVLRTAGILEFFADPLRIYSKDVGMQKDSPAIFRRAAQAASVPTNQCLFVGEDARERSFAREAGMKVAPHPILAAEVLGGQPLCYIRITVAPQNATQAWRALLLRERVVPLKVTGPNGTVVYGIASQRAVARLINMRFGIELFGTPDVPQTTDLFILRDDLAAATGFMDESGEAARFFASDEDASLVVGTAPEGLVVALPANRPLEAFHFRQARHGHHEKLLPDPALLEQGSVGESLGFASAVELAPPPLQPAEIQQLAQITGQALLDRVERYCGKKPVAPGERPIVSRHIFHPANARAVEAAAQEFQALGQGRLTVRLLPFTHAGRTLHNVEAELRGDSPELVLVTAHLDSTAAESRPFDAAQDPAPGADDDASGLAAVLTVAERVLAMTGGTTMPRTMRFVLFNAEEHGLVGSKVYARLQRAKGAAIAAVFQMDMIGYNKVLPRTWEVHAGFAPSPTTEERSLSLAGLLHRVAPVVAPALELPQIYRSTLPGGDPADGRSDHTSFQARGYAACAASEDLFAWAGPGASPEEGNPDYHRKTDTFVDEAFAADITRVVAAAAWLTARSSGP
jgi:bacterial leucyl aminopeptidase